MLIPLDDARICLDCDVVTDREACPACGWEQTFPLAVWPVPLQASQTRPWSGGLRLETGAAARWLTHHAPRHPPRPARHAKDSGPARPVADRGAEGRAGALRLPAPPLPGDAERRGDPRSTCGRAPPERPAAPRPGTPDAAPAAATLGGGPRLVEAGWLPRHRPGGQLPALRGAPRLTASRRRPARQSGGVITRGPG